jgi:hypothetical protein
MIAQAKQVKGMAGFMDAIGNRHSSRSCAWIASMGETASVSDLNSLPRPRLTRMDRVRQCAIYYLIADNRNMVKYLNHTL